MLGFVGEMLPAIELDDETRGMTDEVCDVILDRNLASEAGAGQTMVA